MVNTHLEIAIFAAVALLAPALVLIFSKLVRPESENNEVETQAYESAEESIGQKVTIMDEYMHYFPIFLAFDVIAVIIVLWSIFSRQMDFISNARIELLLVFGFLLEVFALALGRIRG